jgi:hypothetical protein
VCHVEGECQLQNEFDILKDKCRCPTLGVGTSSRMENDHKKII